MKYMGSKARISKDILPILLKKKQCKQYYIEPFAGGMNLIDKVSGLKRIANDINPYLIEMFKYIVYKKWIPKEYYTKEEYFHIKNNINKYKKHIVGWVGFNCSYSGKFFGGFAGITKTKKGIRNYQKEAINNVFKQKDKLKGVLFTNTEYFDIKIPKNSIIYCDPPYKNTTNYKGIKEFNHDLFFNWCRDLKNNNNLVFISEYNAPKDFKEIWVKEVNSSLSSNGLSGGNKKSLEKLFII